MIVSASRRTDIPAFYSEWFFKRLEEGYVQVGNPMNRKQVSEIRLDRENVDCFVFWTKNPEPMRERLHVLDEMGFPYYFQFTLTGYERDVEPGLLDKERVVETFQKLSRQIGKERVIWRYDPVFINPRYTKEFHYQCFEKLCACLEGYTEVCVLSFLDLYVKNRKNVEKLKIAEMTDRDMEDIAEHFSRIAGIYGLTLQTCAEKIDLSAYGIEKGRCIDGKLVEKLVGKPVALKKDGGQREACGCVKSVDIGEYNTCRHFCAYCYANYSPAAVEKNIGKHRVDSGLLTGELRGDEKITVR